MSTEALNDFLQFSVQGEGEAASHSSTLTRLEEASKRTAGEVVEVSNAVVMFVYSLCLRPAAARGINAALCDQLVRQISHLGTRTGNPRFKEDVMKIVADAGTLVDGALAPYLQESEQKAALAAQAAQLEAQLAAEKEAVQEAQTAQAAQTAQCESYQKENEALKERLQQLEDLEAGTMKTMISLDAQDGDTMTQNSLNYLRRQNENLTASNQLYLKRIDELSAFVRTALDKTPAGDAGGAGGAGDARRAGRAGHAGGAGTDKDARSAEAVQTLQKEVEREKGERLLWQTRCEQMEVVLGETLQNRSCITDYELSVLSSVVESLFTWVVDHFVTDLDLDIAIEPLEEEYTRSVRPNGEQRAAHHGGEAVRHPAHHRDCVERADGETVPAGGGDGGGARSSPRAGNGIEKVVCIVVLFATNTRAMTPEKESVGGVEKPQAVHHPHVTHAHLVPLLQGHRQCGDGRVFNRIAGVSPIRHLQLQHSV